MKKLYIDFETRSTVDIKKTGAWKYARHPQTEILCMAWTMGGKVLVYTPDELKEGPGGGFLGDALADGDLQVLAHNAAFEYAIWHEILVKRFGWPALEDPKHWNCTMARAFMCGLPGTLDGAGAALKIKYQKDLHGRSAMLKLCKPIGTDVFGEPLYRTDGELLRILYRYCERDVEAEMELDRRLPELLPSERRIWELDLVMNRRGVRVDTTTAAKAEALAEDLKRELNGSLKRLTRGAVDSATRVAAIKRYLKQYGIEPESLNKQSINVLLTDEKVPVHIKDVLAIRRQVGKSSTAKYRAIVETACDDERVRGALQYHAASTGRWGGRLIQPQNFPKGFDARKQAEALGMIGFEDAGVFSLFYGDNSMDALSNTLRGMIVAAPGKALVVADYNAIEARVLFWEAGDKTTLEKYRKGLNLYVDMARFIYNDKSIQKESHPKEYALAKAAVLGCGYGMGWIKFQATCAGYGIDVSDELAQRAVSAYRTRFSSVRSLWYAVERAAVNAVRDPRRRFSCCDSRVLWGMDASRDFLCCRLPSGRYLRYYKPFLKTVETPHGEKEEIRFRGVDSTTRQFIEQKTYGGKLVENITQAIARDIMANGMLKAEAGGFPVILTVHDEIVAEVDSATSPPNVDRFVKLMCDIPKWADGCPITAEGWSGERYRK